MTEVILFDLDNTLIDFMRMKRLACGAAVDAMIEAGLKADKKETLKLLFRLYDEHGYEYKEVFQALLKETTGKVEYGIVAAGIVAYRKEREGLLVSYPDVVPTLKALRKKGIRLAIVTDAPRIEAWIRLASMRIGGMFDCVVTFDDSGVKKPNPRPFRLALKKLKIRRTEDALVVGDSIERDILPAKKLGMRAALVKYSGTERDTGLADFKIRKFKDLLKII